MYQKNKISHNNLITLFVLLVTSIAIGILAEGAQYIVLNWFEKAVPILLVRASNGASVVFLLSLALIIYLFKTGRVED